MVVFEKQAQDVRTLALGIFKKVWEIGQHFFENPPRIFYENWRLFYKYKLHHFENYDLLEPTVKELIQNGGMPCFIKEERSLINVRHWRELYVKKMHEYIEQPEEWRLCSAIHHPYFINGMRKSMTPPHANIHTMSQVMLLPDEFLNEHMLLEKERRRCAKETLLGIAQRWDLDLH